MELQLHPRLRSWIARGAWGLVILGAAASLALPRSYLLTAIGDSIQCLLLLAALALLATNIPATKGRARLFWTLMSLGCAMWFAAQALWTVFEVFLRREVPNPFVGDGVLFLHLVPMMAAVALRPHRERDEHSNRLGVVDFGLLLVWWLYLYLFAVIPWHYVWFDDRAYGTNFDALYFAEHAALLVAVGIAWSHSKDGWRTVYAHLFGASLLYGVSSVASGIAIDFGKYYTGSLFDIPLLASMAWFCSLGLTGRKASGPAETPALHISGQAAWISRLAMVARLSMPILAGWSVYQSPAPDVVRTYRLLLTLCTMMLMGALASLKQARSDEELAQANLDLREASLSDLLTGTRNRRFLTTFIDADLQQVLRSYTAENPDEEKRNRDLIFYLIDADHFKEINDAYGHDVGDEVLVEMARRISSAIRGSDVLIRWGGEEFLVVSRFTDRENASALAARVLAAVGGELFRVKGGHSLRRTCSIGWAAFPWFVAHPEAVPYEELLRLTDCALYEAKKAGRNQAIGMLPVGDSLVNVAAPVAGDDRAVTHVPVQTVAIQGPQLLKADAAATVTSPKVVSIS